jgi:hypothetical protein
MRALRAGPFTGQGRFTRSFSSARVETPTGASDWWSGESAAGDTFVRRARRILGVAQGRALLQDDEITAEDLEAATADLDSQTSTAAADTGSSVDTSGLNAVYSALTLQIFWLWIGLAIVTGLQLLFVVLDFISRRRKGEGVAAPDPLIFPRMQIFVLYFFVPAIAETAGSMIQSKDDAQLALGILIIIAVPAPMLGFMLYVVIRTQVAVDTIHRGIFYEVNKEEADEVASRRRGPWQWFGIRRSIPEGEWKGRNAREVTFFKRFGLPLEDFHGPPVCRRHCTWELDPVSNRYFRGYLDYWAPEGKDQASKLFRVGQYFRAFSGPIRLTAAFGLAIISTVLDPTAGTKQTILFVVLLSLNVVIILFTQPITAVQDQLVDALSALCETVGVWLLLAIVCVVAFENDLVKRTDLTATLGMAMMLTMASGIVINIIAQLKDGYFSVVDLVAATREYVESKRHMDDVIMRVLMDPNILAKKYANRWMNLTFGVPLNGWPKLGPLTDYEKAYELKKVSELRAKYHKGGRKGSIYLMMKMAGFRKGGYMDFLGIDVNKQKERVRDLAWAVKCIDYDLSKQPTAVVSPKGWWRRVFGRGKSVAPVRTTGEDVEASAKFTSVIIEVNDSGKDPSILRLESLSTHKSSENDDKNGV